MVNLDNIKTGDTIVVEGVAYVSDDNYFIALTDSAIRDRYGKTDGMLKVISHTPEAMAEPTGIGAVVKLRPKTGNHPHQYIIVNSGSSYQPWFMRGYNNLGYTWEDWMETYDAVEILSPGIEVDTA